MTLYPLRDKPLYRATREELLAEVASAAADAYLTARHAAAFLNTAPQVLANWRNKQRGPPFQRIDRFIRYRKRDLKAFMDGRRVITMADRQKEKPNAYEPIPACG